MQGLERTLRRVLLTGAVLGLAACQAGTGPTAVKTPGPSTVTVNGVRLVTVRNEPGLALADGETVQRVKAREGATLSTGDARLSILPGSMSWSNAFVTMTAENNGFVSFVFGPSGLGFSPAATLTISAAKANLDGISPTSLRIAGASDGVDNWTVVGGSYDPLTDTVTTPILHFSRYALCVE